MLEFLQRMKQNIPGIIPKNTAVDQPGVKANKSSAPVEKLNGKCKCPYVFSVTKYTLKSFVSMWLFISLKTFGFDVDSNHGRAIASPYHSATEA